MALSKSFWEINQSEINFHLAHVKRHPGFQPFLQRDAIRVTMRARDLRFVTMLHYRYLLKSYYEVDPENLLEVLYVDTVEESPRYILDTATGQDKPSYPELCLFYLHISAPGDALTVEQIFRRFDKHRLSGISFHLCSGK